MSNEKHHWMNQHSLGSLRKDESPRTYNNTCALSVKRRHELEDRIEKKKLDSLDQLLEMME